MGAPNVSAAILAGGRARRYDGRDKSRLVVEGRYIIVRQVEVLQRVASEVFVVGPQADAFEDLDLRVYADLIPDAGAIGGVYTALAVAHADLVLVVACDLPFLDDRLLSRLVVHADRHDGAWISTHRGVEPLVACYRQQCLDRIRDRIERRVLRLNMLDDVLDMARLTEEDFADLGTAERLLANVNTPDDYARVQYPAS